MHDEVNATPHQALDVVVLTLFPDMFTGILQESILKRAAERGVFRFEAVNFRDYAEDKHHTVDDYPFGGGAGMLIKPAPLFAAVEAVRERIAIRCEDRTAVGERVILLSPQGRPFTQALAREFSQTERLVFICGHYEGIDDRVRKHLVTDEVSLGDFVMTGGEIAAMAIVDAVVRLLPGALGNADSFADESFSEGLLEYPQYTRPAQFRDWTVPNVLLSGNHQHVAAWRRTHALYRTWKRRPELLKFVALTAFDERLLAQFAVGDFSAVEVHD